MRWAAFVHTAVWRTIPRDEAERVRLVLRRVARAADPLQAPGVRALETRGARTFRVRVGRYRVVGEALPAESMLVFTTAFLKRRASDYALALQVHHVRLEAARRASAPPGEQEGGSGDTETYDD